jgi:hypothetical protein
MEKARPPINLHRNGRVKVAARRLFLLSDTISTGDLRAFAYCRRPRVGPGYYAWLRRVLRGIAVPIGRGGGRGRPTLWRLRNGGAEK